MIKPFVLPDLKQAQRRLKGETPIERSIFDIPEALLEAGRGKTYYIRTYGCQANERDSETIRGILESMAFTPIDTMETADLIVLNTCAIRENAENKVFGEIGQIKRFKLTNPDLLFMVGGCMTQEEHVVNRILSKHPQVDVLFGTHNLHRIPQLMLQAYFSKERVVEVFSKEGEVYENLPVSRNSANKAWVNIMYGCDKFCTYCIVPYTRGKERSRLPEDILNEVRELAAQGYKEVTLLGQNVNAYGKDLGIGMDFANLLDQVAQCGIPRLRFMTSHPWDFTDHLIEVMASRSTIMPFLHLPLQSGNDDVLRIMGRRYSAQAYLDLVDRLKARIPHLALSTDIIVGFPNESEAQFMDTIKMLEQVRFDNVYSFVYSARESTPAAKMHDNVSQDIKEDRLKRLNAVIGTHALAKAKAVVGQTVTVLVDGPSKKNPAIFSGYTDTNKLVNFVPTSAKSGDLVRVLIESARTWTLQGKQVAS
jgi:tRNA-2-methylthio-N6-dimethylallyladenosine synthase